MRPGHLTRMRCGRMGVEPRRLGCSPGSACTALFQIGFIGNAWLNVLLSQIYPTLTQTAKYAAYLAGVCANKKAGVCVALRHSPEKGEQEGMVGM